MFEEVKMPSILAVVCVYTALLPVTSAYSLYFSTNICSGRMVDGKIQANVESCPVPDYMYGAETPTFPSYTHHVSKPAKLEDVMVTWFLNTDRSPALNVSIKATSPNSPQQYEVNVLTEGYLTSIYCGLISTPKPKQGDVPQKQRLGLEVRCPGDAFKVNAEVQVAVTVKGNPLNTPPLVIPMTLPGCNDPIMRESNECIAKRKRRITFRLEQKGNSTVAILNTKTAYLTQDPYAQVYAAIAQKSNETAMGWKFVSPYQTLTWPQRIATFNDLTLGETYKVVVWRSNEMLRYTEVITMKMDQKEKRVDNFIKRKRLAKRKARRARARSE